LEFPSNAFEIILDSKTNKKLIQVKRIYLERKLSETFFDDTNPLNEDGQKRQTSESKGNKILIRKTNRINHPDQIVEEEDEYYEYTNLSKSDMISIEQNKKKRPNSINSNYQSINDLNDKSDEAEVIKEENVDSKNKNDDRFKINLNYKEIIRSKSSELEKGIK
jgi:hypothetical protein